MLLIAVTIFVPPADARHDDRPTEQRLRCPKLVEHAYPSTYGQPVPYSPIVSSDRDVLKYLTQDGMTSCRVRPEFARTHCVLLPQIVGAFAETAEIATKRTASAENHRHQPSEMRAGSSHGRADPNAPRQHQSNAA
jgi:hypothetical protein